MGLKTPTALPFIFYVVQVQMKTIQYTVHKSNHNSSRELDLP